MPKMTWQAIEVTQKIRNANVSFTWIYDLFEALASVPTSKRSSSCNTTEPYATRYEGCPRL